MRERGKWMNRIVCGIDPGQQGAIVFIDTETNEVDYVKMPETFADVYNVLKDKYIENSGNICCALEDVGQGMPGQSSSATAKFARHNGHLEMALYAIGIPTVKVKPQKWQKSLGIGTGKDLSKTEWKNKLKAEAQRRYPNVKITLWLADALLIADYGVREINNQK